MVRTGGTILNGHKRVRAAEVAGPDRHSVKVVDMTDDQAAEIFAIAHREQAVDTDADALDTYTFVFTGALSQETSTIEAVVENHGGRVVEAIGDSVDYLITGDHPDDKRRAAAEQAGVPTPNERA